MRLITRCRWTLTVLMTLLAMLCTSACSVQPTATAAAGPRKQVCGQWIGRAWDKGSPGPFFVDGSTTDVSVSAMAHSSGSWVQVSDDCDHGAVVSLPVSASVVICGQLPAGSGADIAVLLTPRDPGSTVLQVTHADGSVTHIDMTVTTAIRNDDAAPPSDC